MPHSSKPDGPDEHHDSIFKVTEMSTSSLPPATAGFLLGKLLNPEDAGIFSSKILGFL
jgi:hypothetical protein